jgi:hypothetical protein
MSCVAACLQLVHEIGQRGLRNLSNRKTSLHHHAVSVLLCIAALL